MASVDFAYLENFVGGDVSIALEVLTVFQQQAPIWAVGLDLANPDWRAVAHTVKGAARGIGAEPLAERCHQAEFGDPAELPAVLAALDAAVADIRAYEAEKARR